MKNVISTSNTAQTAPATAAAVRSASPSPEVNTLYNSQAACLVFSCGIVFKVSSLPGLVYSEMRSDTLWLYLFMIALDLLCLAATFFFASCGADEKLIDDAIKYVEKNIARSDLSVEELSHELGMSRAHLYKKLLQITGKTPIEFIRVIRLKRAAQLLRESQQNVSEIAYQLGFNNPKYFSKYFKDEFGVLPSVYQEREGK